MSTCFKKNDIYEENKDENEIKEDEKEEKIKKN